MKKLHVVSALLIFSLIFSTFSCTQNRIIQQDVVAPTASNPEMVAWNTNLDGFHSIMSSTFHPAEEGNLEPLKTQAANMAERAATWAKAGVPSSMKGKGVEDLLRQLAEGSKNLADLVKNNASNQVLVEAITKLHDSFHGIMEASGGH